MAKYLITGTAGFIGYHLAEEILKRGNEIVGLDNLNAYYDVNLKLARLGESGITGTEAEPGRFVQSKKWPGYRFVRMDLQDKGRLMKLFKEEKFEYVINLAAQAGVRYSIDNPDTYISSNITGFFNILEACRYNPVKYLLYASSSSVYGNNSKLPFSETDDTDNPVSLYAATKKSNELLACAYHNLYRIPLTGLRFFTVYGPWGRPDMAIFKFTDAIMKGNPVRVYGEGKLLRDFTYVSDIINGIMALLDKLSEKAPPPVLNIGNSSPVTVSTLVSVIENCTGKKAIVEFLPEQPGDVRATYADINLINRYCGFRPQTDLKSGIEEFRKWYKMYYKV